MFPKIGVGPPNHPFVHRVFHEINHPFWGFSPYFWKHPDSKLSLFKSLENMSQCDSRDKDGCTPNVRVPMVFIVFNLGILGNFNPLNTHVL